MSSEGERDDGGRGVLGVLLHAGEERGHEHNVEGGWGITDDRGGVGGRRERG